MKILDITNLDENATTGDISNLCQIAKDNSYFVAGVCVYPNYVKQVHVALQETGIKTVTVVNFPYGKDSYIHICNETEKAIKNGADEIDLVIDWERWNKYQNGVFELVLNVRKSCRGKLLKVILETGELKPELIFTAATEAMNAGADFLKTSTGKTKNGASLKTVELLAKSIQRFNLNFPEKKNVGLKISGGVKTSEQAAFYLQLVNQYITNAPAPDNFRFGVGINSQVLKQWQEQRNQ